MLIEAVLGGETLGADVTLELLRHTDLYPVDKELMSHQARFLRVGIMAVLADERLRFRVIDFVILRVILVILQLAIGHEGFAALIAFDAVSVHQQMVVQASLALEFRGAKVTAERKDDLLSRLLV